MAPVPNARRPRRIAAVYSARRRILAAAGSTRRPGALRPSGARVPYGDAPPGWHGQHACACAAGSRGSSRGGGCSAGRCACSRQVLQIDLFDRFSMSTRPLRRPLIGETHRDGREPDRCNAGRFPAHAEPSLARVEA